MSGSKFRTFIFDEPSAEIDMMVHVNWAAKYFNIPRLMVIKLAKEKKRILDASTCRLGISIPKFAPYDATCPGCLEKVNLATDGVSISFAPCNHIMHYECATIMVKSLREQNKEVYNCLFQNCGGVMHDDSYSLLVKDSSHPLISNAYKRCPHDGCSKIHRSFIETTPNICQITACSCNKLFCFNCRGQVHNGTCSKYHTVQQALVDAKRIEKDESIRMWLALTYADAFNLYLSPKWYCVEELIEGNSYAFSYKDKVELIKTIQTTSPSFKFPTIDNDEKITDFETIIKSAEKVIVDASEILEVSNDPYLEIPESLPEFRSVISGGHPYKFVYDVDDIESRSKFCPNCFIRIERSDGCPSMTCSMCEYKFCYNCLGPQHTHSVCDKSVNMDALVAAATIKGGDALQAIRGLIKFTPEVELYEKAKKSRALTETICRKFQKYKNQRISRLFPMAMLVGQLKIALIAPSQQLQTIMGLTSSIRQYVTNEYQLQKIVEPYFTTYMVDKLDDPIRDIVDSRISDSTVSSIKSAAITRLIDIKLMKQIEFIDSRINSNIFDRPVCKGLLSGVFPPSRSTLYTGVGGFTDANGESQSQYIVDGFSCSAFMLPIGNSKRYGYTHVLLKSNCCNEFTAETESPSTIHSIQNLVFQIRNVMMEELEKCRAALFVDKPSLEFRYPRTYKMGDLVMAERTEYDNDGYATTVNVTGHIIPSSELFPPYPSVGAGGVTDNSKYIPVIHETEPLFVGGLSIRGQVAREALATVLFGYSDSDNDNSIIYNIGCAIKAYHESFKNKKGFNNVVVDELITTLERIETTLQELVEYLVVDPTPKLSSITESCTDIANNRKISIMVKPGATYASLFKNPNAS